MRLVLLVHGSEHVIIVILLLTLLLLLRFARRRRPWPLEPLPELMNPFLQLVVLVASSSCRARYAFRQRSLPLQLHAHVLTWRPV